MKSHMKRSIMPLKVMRSSVTVVMRGLLIPTAALLLPFIGYGDSQSKGGANKDQHGKDQDFPSVFGITLGTTLDVVNRNRAANLNAPDELWYCIDVDKTNCAPFKVVWVCLSERTHTICEIKAWNNDVSCAGGLDKAWDAARKVFDQIDPKSKKSKGPTENVRSVFSSSDRANCLLSFDGLNLELRVGNTELTSKMEEERPIKVRGTLLMEGLSRGKKPKAGEYFHCVSPVAGLGIEVVQCVEKGVYRCTLRDIGDGRFLREFLDNFIIETHREYADGDKMDNDGIFTYIGMTSYKSVMGAMTTVRRFKEVEGPKVQEFYALEADRLRREQADRKRKEMERVEKEKEFNIEAMTNVQNFIKSLKLDLDPRNRIHIDKCLRDKLKVIVPNETKVAIEAKNVGDVGRLRGAKDLVESYKENRKLTQEAALRFYNEAFRHLNQEVRMEWSGFGPTMQGEGKERVAPTLAIIRIHGQDKKLAKVCYKNDRFTPFDKTDSCLRKQKNRYADIETKIDDELNGDLIIRADLSFDKTEALFVFCVDGNELDLKMKVKELYRKLNELKGTSFNQNIKDLEAELKKWKSIETEVNARENWSYGFKRAEAAFNAIAPKHEELKKQLKREEISKEDFGKRSIELKKELYAALIKACENEGVEKVVAEKRETESTVAKERKDITAVAKKRFVEQVDPRNRVYIDNAITNNVCALVPKKIREGIDALRNGNFTFFAAISNPNNGMLSDNEIKQIDLAIKRLSREVRLECRHGHPGVMIFKVHMGDDEWVELNGKKHGHDDFVKYGLIDFEMDQEFDRVYNNMRESYSHVKLEREAGSLFLKESVPIDERMFVFGRGTRGFEFAIKAFTGAIAWRKKLYDQRCLSKARDDDSFTEEEYKKKIGELKVKFCEYLKKAIDM